MADVRVQLNRSGLAQLLTSETGPLAQLLLRLGSRGAEVARDRVGVSEGEGPHLRDAIVTRLETGPAGPLVKFGTFEPGVGRALFHHNGTQPHEIHPRNAKAMVFNWPTVNAVAIVPMGGAGFTGHFAKGTRFMIGKGYVNHPGTKPNPYLTDALLQLQSEF